MGLVRIALSPQSVVVVVDLRPTVKRPLKHARKLHRIPTSDQNKGILSLLCTGDSFALALQVLVRELVVNLHVDLSTT